MTTLLFVRHGRTAYNDQGRMQGGIDIPLDAVGRAQADDLSSALASAELAAVYASPLSRARSTAAVLAAPHRLEVREDPAFRERGFGPWEGLTRAEIAERWPEEHARWNRGQSVDGMGVESRAEVAMRVSVRARELVEDHEGLVVVVSHGAAITLGIGGLLGLDADGPRILGGLDNCGCSVLVPLQNPTSEATMRLVSHNGRPDFAMRARTV